MTSEKMTSPGSLGDAFVQPEAAVLLVLCSRMWLSLAAGQKTSWQHILHPSSRGTLLFNLRRVFICRQAIV